MVLSRTRALAQYAERATRLLAGLEQLDAKAYAALDDGRPTDFFAAVAERDMVMGQLSEVIDAFTRESELAKRVGAGSGIEVDAGPIFADMSRAATAALESQQQLTARTARERNRLAAALHNTNRPDAVASQYGVGNGVRRSGTLSVTG
jgi:signal transduction histidine kinase